MSANFVILLLHFVKIFREINNSLLLTFQGVTVVSIGPGWCKTELARNVGMSLITKILMAPFAFLFMRTGREGAQNIIHAVLEEDSYFKVISRKKMKNVNIQLKIRNFFLSEWIFLPRFQTYNERKPKS